MAKLAVVLFNLGGPDRPEAVEPFLFNLFNDPAIIGAPAPLRWLLAKLISKRRAPIARNIYGHIGGGSPLLENTMAQARALEARLRDLGDVRCFVAMRYWHPFIDEAAAAVKAFAPDRIVLLPLYPQFSTTTAGSSLTAWFRSAQSAGLAAPQYAICCYPRNEGFIGAVAQSVEDALAKMDDVGPPRVLFSAHGLPKKIVAAGDPYPWQVEQSCAAVVASLGKRDLDWVLCYQSRVGPLEWIGPATDKEIERAGGDKVPVVVVPIAFVSEHSETLVELDIEYAALARRAGVPAYVRAPTVSAGDAFIAGLARLVRTRSGGVDGVEPEGGHRICPVHCVKCPIG
ncbi:MAG TPA: ferrochelatase [Alphaproteobacteria bacterium]|nr:ferrochelatase [Alphaproteobacteria bacterium]